MRHLLRRNILLFLQLFLNKVVPNALITPKLDVLPLFFKVAISLRGSSRLILRLIAIGFRIYCRQIRSALIDLQFFLITSIESTKNVSQDLITDTTKAFKASHQLFNRPHTLLSIKTSHFSSFTRNGYFFFLKKEASSSTNELKDKFTLTSRVLSFAALFHVLGFWGKLRVMYYVNNWVYTTNHKRIAVNYFWFVILSGIVGMVLATVIRLEFAYPGVGVFAGDSIQYLSLASAHGVIMVFFMIMPLLFGAFSNFLLPTQLGVHDVAFPRLNSAAFWFLPGGLLMLCQLVCVDRRYQRMNCFNIREVQSLLKRRFFVDLVNSQDSHTLLDKTTIGLRYRLSNITNVNGNFLLLLNFGPNFSAQSHVNPFAHSTNNSSLRSVEFVRHYVFSTFLSLVDSLNVYFVVNIANRIALNILYRLDTEAILDAKFYKQSLPAFPGFAMFPALEPFFFAENSIYGSDIGSVYRYLKFHLIQRMLIAHRVTSAAFDRMWELLTISSWNEVRDFFLQWVLSPLQIRYFSTSLIVNFTHTRAADNTNSLFINILNYLSESFQTFSSLLVQRIFSIFFFLEKKTFSDAPSFLVLFFSPTLFLNDALSTYYNVASLFNAGRYFVFNSFYRNVDLSRYAENASVYSVNDHFFIFTNVSFFFFFLSNLPNALYHFLTNTFSYNTLLSIFFQIFNFFFFNSFLLSINTNLIYDLNLFINLFFTSFDRSNFSISSFFFFVKNTCYDNVFFFYLPARTLVIDFVSIDGDLAVSYSLFNSLNCLFSFVYSSLLSALTYGSFLLVGPQTFSLFTYVYDSVLSRLLLDKHFLYQYGFDLAFKANYFFSLTQNGLSSLNSEENSSSTRIKKNENPVFRYDYKAGDYFPKLNKEAYPHLFSTILNLTSGLRTAPWFFSNNFELTFNNTFIAVDSYLAKPLPTICAFKAHQTQTNRIFHTNSYYNLFFSIDSFSSINQQWFSLLSLNQKFYRMFTTSSMQQRIYSNWRQLKFSREAWRCKLLAARHQKTLFKRYLHEDGVFWSIERNAKDLIPGWAMITPFSSRLRFTAIGKTDIGLMGVLLVLNSSIISAANFLVTYRYLSTLNNRKIRDARAFFTEAVIVASWMMILANPMLVIGIVMLLSDRHWHTSFFDYSGGGDTVLFQHMFWFFGHPEVYIIIIPTFGFTNTMLSFYLRKRVSARASLLYSMYTIAFLGFFVWGHHMYMVGLAHTTRMLFSTLTVMISVPAATKIMHWCVTTVNSSFAMELPLLFTFTFIFFFVSGGISGMCVAHTGMDVLFHDTFYVIGHFHVMLAGGAMFASFGAFYFYFPAIFGVKFSRIYAYLHYTYYLIGQLMTVIPMFWLGYAGMPRRVLDYPSSFGGWHSVISAGHMLNVAGLIAFFIMIFDSLRQGRAATRNTFGINRYNVRLNFYIYEIAKLNFIDQKSLFLLKYYPTKNILLNGSNYNNYEHYETVLLSYVFLENKQEDR